MDPKLIGQNWAKFLKQQINQLNTSIDEDPLTSNPFYTKYAAKLKTVKLDEQLNGELKQNKVNKQFVLGEEERKFKEQLIELEKRLEKRTVDFDSKLDGQKSVDHKLMDKKLMDKKLNDVIKLDLIKDLDKESIRKLWFEYFKNRDATVFACLNANQFDQIKENAKKNPIFVFLLPVYDAETMKKQATDQKNNYQFVLVQFDNTKSSLKVHFTPLAFFHAHKENAPATLVLNYYSEIKADKDIVLLEGEYDDKIFNQLEAQCLANQIQIFYSNQDKIALLNNFTNNPATFDYMDIVKEFEKSLVV